MPQRKFDVLKTNICQRSQASRKNILVLPPFSLIRDFGKQNTRGNVSNSVLLTDRIEIHQLQPDSITQRRLEGHTSACNWWISIRSVNTQATEIFWKRALTIWMEFSVVFPGQMELHYFPLRKRNRLNRIIWSELFPRLFCFPKSRSNEYDGKNIKFTRGNHQTNSFETNNLLLYCSPLNFLRSS